MLVDELLVLEAIDHLRLSVIASQSKKGLRASGRSAKSLHGTIRKTRNGIVAELRGSDYWQYQQRGRGPGKSAKPSKGLVDAIRAWTKFKGIAIEAAYRIAYNVNKFGTKVPNAHNPGDVLGEPLAPANVANYLRPILASAYRVAFTKLLFG